MTDQDELLGRCEQAAVELISAFQAAAEAGVPPIVLIPKLLSVLRGAGMSEEGLGILGSIQ